MGLVLGEFLMSLARILYLSILFTVSHAPIACGEELNRNTSLESDQAMNIEVNASPTRPYAGTTLVSCLNPLMRFAGHPEWSMARLQGILGHAFHFEMKANGDFVMHDNLDWGSRALAVLSNLIEFRNFSATKHDTEVDLPALKLEACKAVRASLAHGIPALVWQPMTPEMKSNGQYAFCWGLIVGYNEEEETYSVRHPNLKNDYTIRYDALGKTDGAQWFNIRTFENILDLDEKPTHLAALNNAISFADGKRFKEEHEETQRGLLAYDLWRKAFESKDVSPEPSRYHAEILKGRRQAASQYMRKLIPKFPEADKYLEEAAVHYDNEFEILDSLHDLCSLAHEAGVFSAEERSDARRFIGEALKSEQMAIASIKAAISAY